MITLYVLYKTSKISDHWMADIQDLELQLRNLMPDVKGYSSHGFKQYKWYKIQDIFRCYNSDVPCEGEGCRIIELNVIPKNL
jgi:hypothetical protein